MVTRGNKSINICMRQHTSSWQELQILKDSQECTAAHAKQLKLQKWLCLCLEHLQQNKDAWPTFSTPLSGLEASRASLAEEKVMGWFVWPPFLSLRGLHWESYKMRLPAAVRLTSCSTGGRWQLSRGRGKVNGKYKTAHL